MQHSIALLQFDAIIGVRSDMEWMQVIWDHSPDGNVQHFDEHDLTIDEVDFVLENYDVKRRSRSSGRPCVFGYTPDGRYIVVIYQEVGDAIIPITAYDIDEP